MNKSLLDEAEKLIKDGDYLLAKNKLKGLITKDYDNIKLWEIIKEAEVNLKENSDFSHQRLIELYLRNNKTLKANETLENLTKINPEFDYRYFYKGQIFNIEEKQTKNDPLVVYCGDPGCGDSEDLAYDLQNEGFTKLFVFKGGWLEWSKTNYPISGKR